jgi:hypothetical protein
VCYAIADLNFKMKYSFSIIFLLATMCSFAQMKVKKIDSTKLPKTIKFAGQITNSAKWTDSFGTHYVLTTETGEYFSKDQEDNEFRNAELFVYHYVIKNDSLKLVWKIYDHNKNCEFDVFTKFIDKAFKVTDLDKNGIAEVWVMYENQCTSDVSPAPTKIIMYEGNKKYAIRGENKVRVSEKAIFGGQYSLDENFKKGNPLFRQFGIALWEKNILKKW